MKTATNKSTIAGPVVSAGGTVRIFERPMFIVAVLVLVTLAVYGPAVTFDFTNIDDPTFFVQNIHVQAGLTWNSLAWAFRFGQGDYWHPLTWVSFMVDVELFGNGPAEPHCVNILLHAFNTALVFLLLNRLTGARWQSAIVAGLFGLHPLRVESVAWVTERKDVLSAFFGFLSLVFYARYAESKTRNSKLEIRSRKSEVFSLEPSSILHPPSSLCYPLSLFFFTCGLMCKAMLVTWPCVLLLLDWWPLKRFPNSDYRLPIWRLFREKIPFFALSLASCMVTLWTAKKSVATLGSMSVMGRIENAFVSCGRYLGKTFWPVNLAVYYPQDHWSWLQVAGAVVLVVGLCVSALVLSRRRPYVFVGWFWFLVTISPVIGVIQVGGQSIADRFTYVPSIGFFILLVWGIHEVSDRFRAVKLPMLVATFLCLLALAGRTQNQLRYWLNSETLFRHALAVTGRNPLAELNLGSYLYNQGQTAEAVVHFQKALDISPDFAPALNGMGWALVQQGQAAEAIPYLRKALKFQPDFPRALKNLGVALGTVGQYSEAVACFQKVLQDDPSDPEVHFNLALALSKSGRLDDAIQEFRWVLRHAPNISGLQHQLGLALLRKGERREAIVYLRAAATLNPDIADALNSLAWVLATSSDAQLRDGAEAVKLAERAVQVTRHVNPGAMDTLAAAYAEAGRFEDAVAMARKALDRVGASGKETLVKDIRKHLEAYQSNQPWRE